MLFLGLSVFFEGFGSVPSPITHSLLLSDADRRRLRRRGREPLALSVLRNRSSLHPSPFWFGFLIGALRYGPWARYRLDGLLLVDRRMNTSHLYAHGDCFKNNKNTRMVQAGESEPDDRRNGESRHANPASIERYDLDRVERFGGDIECWWNEGPNGLHPVASRSFRFGRSTARLVPQGMPDARMR